VAATMDLSAEKAPRVRRQSALSGPEHKLVSAALARHPGFVSRQQLFQEPALPTGFPDLVIVVLAKDSCLALPARSRVTELHLRLLQHVSRTGRTTFHEIAGDLLWKTHRVEAVANDLVAAELASVDDGDVEARPLSEIFVARRIIAVEAKIRDWRHAIDQAQANTWFASHSLILLPTERFNDRVADAAKESGVGVLTFDGLNISVPVKPVEYPIPASYGSWLFNEWALHRVRGRVGLA
jgi:hypothetical protein